MPAVTKSLLGARLDRSDDDSQLRLSRLVNLEFAEVQKNERLYAHIGIETIYVVVSWTYDAASDERQSSLYCSFAGRDRHPRGRFCPD